jgi:AGZA family xanthine/uracil permease-like MFS transporter
MVSLMRLFVARDLDGFFGLFIDNLVQLLLIIALCQGLCGMTGENESFLYERILPGAAVSVLFGNLFYAWQARRLAKRLGRNDVTALPYGINTPSVIAFVVFVMAPTYARTQSVEAAWRIGVLACLASGLIEFVGAFVARRIRSGTPRAALLSTLSGIAIGYIAMQFALQIWTRPLIAVVPMALVLLTYAGRWRFPMSLPGGLVALAVGTALAWILWAAGSPTTVDPNGVRAALEGQQWHWPQWFGEEVWRILSQPSEWAPFLSVIIPMALFNLIGSLQNIESAEAAGDPYDTQSSLVVNGLSSVVAGLFGSCFPTTIYIGHPGWKELGARTGYSTLNGIAITLLCFSGAVGLVKAVVPMEAGIAIVLWIGIIIVAQAFQTTPKQHAPAVAVGLFPAIAAWGATLALGVLVKTNATAEAFLKGDIAVDFNGYMLHGMISLERGFIFTCMILAAACTCLIDRNFVRAGVWAAILAAMTGLGLCHAYQVVGNNVDFLLLGMTPTEGAFVYRAWDVASGYAVVAVVFFLVGWKQAVSPSAPTGEH